MDILFLTSELQGIDKTGGLGDVMYALPRALKKEGCEVRVILPFYNCIPDKFKEKMTYQGSFMMDLTMEGRTFYVGIMETEIDGNGLFVFSPGVNHPIPPEQSLPGIALHLLPGRKSSGAEDHPAEKSG